MLATKESIKLGRASGVKTLKPFPPAAAKLIELISQEGVDYRDVSRLLTTDAAFTSQVLRVANSALLGARHEVKSIVQALSLVGVDRLRSLVVTVAMNCYAGRGESAFLGRSWRHNLATAIWCETLAGQCNVAKPLGYTAGMLHDIGRIALLMLFPEDYARFLGGAPSSDPDPLEAERKLFDVDHCQIGEYLAGSWNFPTALRDMIAQHHEPVSRETPRLRLLVQAACSAAHMSGFAATAADQPWEPGRIVDLLPHHRESLLPRWEELFEQVTRKFNEVERSLA